MCHVLPVLFVLALAGAGIVIWQTVGKQKPQEAVVLPAGAPLTFSVNMKLPQDASGSTCSGLFYGANKTKGDSGTVVSGATSSHASKVCMLHGDGLHAA